VTYLLPHLEALFDIPANTMTVILIMCSAAMYFIRPHLVIPGMVFVLGPLVVVLSALANYAVTSLEYFPLNQTDQWLICTMISATIGVIVGLGLAAGLGRMMSSAEAKKSRFHRA
jgi:hypothetical protein